VKRKGKKGDKGKKMIAALLHFDLRQFNETLPALCIVHPI
jgi:hypothetical protein